MISKAQVSCLGLCLGRERHILACSGACSHFKLSAIDISPARIRIAIIIIAIRIRINAAGLGLPVVTLRPGVYRIVRIMRFCINIQACAMYLDISSAVW